MATDPSSSSPASSLVRFHKGNLDCVRIRGTDSTIELATQGAHLISWEPAGERPVLFLSKRSAFQQGKAIRGGIPLIFPWFGARDGHPEAAAHGFARTAVWQLERAEVDKSGRPYVNLSLPALAASGHNWPHSAEVSFEANAGTELELLLRIHNTGNRDLPFEAAFHTYFAISDIRQVTVHGLENTDYLDKPTGNRRMRQEPTPIRFSGETDRIYLNTATTCTIEDPGWQRRIVITKTGSRATVVWNPWQERASAMADLGSDQWSGMLCVESAIASENKVVLPPGGEHVLTVRIHVERL